MDGRSIPSAFICGGNKLSNDQTFRTFLDVKRYQFIRHGLLDQPLAKDANYYIDIFKFKDLDIPEFENSYANFLSHFSKFFHLVKVSQRNGLSGLTPGQVMSLSQSAIKDIFRNSDPAYQAAFNLLDFREVDGFNLGYAKSLRGASIGPSFKVQLIKAAQELHALKIDDPEVFCLLPFLQEGIGCDRISDMFISINYVDFLKYTARKLNEMGVMGLKPTKFEDITLQLAKPKKFKGPLILIPKRLVKHLPMSFCWSDIFECYDENSALRSRLSAIILANYSKKSEVTKSNVVSLLKSQPGLLREIIGEFKNTTSLTKLEGEVNSQIESEIASLKIPVAKTLKEQINFIINTFKTYVERKGVWRLFYHRSKDENGEKIKQPLSEEHIQRAFYLVADLIAEKFEVDVIPESESGLGPVDFKFVKLRTNVLVEVKLSTHQNINHGYVTQLEEYIESERPEYSFFLLVKLTNACAEQMQVDERRVKRLLSVGKQKHKEIILVDATIKASASKVR